jgi:glutamate-1-semialdehyde 2,1-aminomutase
MVGLLYSVARIISPAMAINAAFSRPVDEALISRAVKALPRGVYGHMSRDLLWPGAPQFMARGDGSRIWDVDGNEYVDLMCSYGPILLGHRHPRVEEAVLRQHHHIDCGNGPAPVMIDLAERLIEIVDHADWTIFAKNGSDATTLCLTLARAYTERSTILVAEGAYHGALPWCTPNPLGTIPSDRANLAYYRYNDLGSVMAKARAHGGDLAGIIVSPFRHDAGFDQELPDPAFAEGLRDLCDRTGAQLILDDVRAGFRVSHGSSWEPLGVYPDLSAWSKAIANGYPLAAALGAEHLREVAASVYVTGSFWFGADAMAAGLATLDALADEDGVGQIHAWGSRFWTGVEEAASKRSVPIKLTGHVSMPYLTFADDPEHVQGDLFAAACAASGLFVHPRHNWFVSTALTEVDLEVALGAVGEGFDAVCPDPSV